MSMYQQRKYVINLKNQKNIGQAQTLRNSHSEYKKEEMTSTKTKINNLQFPELMGGYEDSPK